jgi:GDP-L-fucose synthase
MLMNDNPYGAEPVNMGYGTDMTIKELAEMTARLAGFKGEIIWDAAKPDGMREKLMDTTRARAIGFVPEITPERGIGMFIEDYRKSRACS